jgi:hypothetical protein
MSNFPDRVNRRIRHMRQKDSGSESEQSEQSDDGDPIESDQSAEEDDLSSVSGGGQMGEPPEADDITTRLLWIIGTAVAAVLIWALITYMPIKLM